MKNKILFMLALVVVTTFVTAAPVQARHHRSNNSAAIGIGAFCLGALLANGLRQPEPRYVERETVVVPQRETVIVPQTVVYREPVRHVRHTRVYQPAPVQYERVIDYYQY